MERAFKLTNIKLLVGLFVCVFVFGLFAITDIDAANSTSTATSTLENEVESESMFRYQNKEEENEEEENEEEENEEEENEEEENEEEENEEEENEDICIGKAGMVEGDMSCCPGLAKYEKSGEEGGFYCFPEYQDQKQSSESPQNYNPVCGDDGQTYPNSWISSNTGVEVEKEGRCHPDNFGKEVSSMAKHLRNGEVDALLKKISEKKQEMLEKKQEMLEKKQEMLEKKQEMLEKKQEMTQQKNRKKEQKQEEVDEWLEEVDEYLEKISEKKQEMMQQNVSKQVEQLKQNAELMKQKSNQKMKELLGTSSNISQTTIKSIKNFLTYGANNNTHQLGLGERAAVMHSYKKAFGKLPNKETELEDALKIANGRWPTIRNQKAEADAKERFQEIYDRIPNMDKSHDNAAVTVMTYGLRQRAENRNLNSEKKGIQIFKSIFGRTPQDTEDWNIMQGITYSGAKKKQDSDNDLLSDEWEQELGTNPNNQDTDGDGYMDGVEKGSGNDPLNQ